MVLQVDKLLSILPVQKCGDLAPERSPLEMMQFAADLGLTLRRDSNAFELNFFSEVLQDCKKYSLPMLLAQVTADELPKPAHQVPILPAKKSGVPLVIEDDEDEQEPKKARTESGFALF